VSVDRVSLSRDDLPRVVEHLRAWEARDGYPGGLHVGDVGWHARLPADQFDGTLVAFVREDAWVAFALVEPGLVRPRLAPAATYDPEVAAALADAADAVDGVDVLCDADPGTPFRAALATRGWVADVRSWTALYRSLSLDDVFDADPLTAATSSRRTSSSAGGAPLVADEVAVADRVVVQRGAFDRSTFTVEAWHRMADGPGFEPSLDLLRRTPSGEPAAACTAWLSRPGACAILEPVGTHREHRGQGHGKAVVLAAIEALASAGASGVCVHTPSDNTAAVAAYLACGMHAVSYDHDMVRRRG
jgi:GNAT superfamily N-acetyltransferase